MALHDFTDVLWKEERPRIEMLFSFEYELKKISKEFQLIQWAHWVWRRIGKQLALSDDTLDRIEMEYEGSTEERLLQVFLVWIEQGTSAYPVTWRGLISMLKDCKLNDIADSLQLALEHRKQEGDTEDICHPVQSGLP